LSLGILSFKSFLVFPSWLLWFGVTFLVEVLFGGNQILKILSYEVQTKVELQATREVHKEKTQSKHLSEPKEE